MYMPFLKLQLKNFSIEILQNYNLGKISTNQRFQCLFNSQKQVRFIYRRKYIMSCQNDI